MMRRSLLLVLAAVGSWSAFALNLKGGLPTNDGIHSVSTTKKYLIASFPDIRQVAYTHLPDTIWRPLYLGDVGTPKGVATDATNSRLFVADAALNKIFWYRLIIEDDGLLKTDGQQHTAVDNVVAHWMTVNGVGDLYFSGQMIVNPPAVSTRSVYRMDGEKIARGDAMGPIAVYTRSNTGYPVPKVWMPSGVAVDSFDIYWGNQEKGVESGAVCSGARQNIGITSVLETNKLTSANFEVRGMAVAGQNIFYITPEAIYGIDKSSADIKDPNIGMIQTMENLPEGWNPISMAFDGEGTVYWTERSRGTIYQFPAMDTNAHPIHKYVDAPLVYGVAVFAKTGSSTGAQPLQKNYGLMMSNAQADESGVPAACHLHFLTTLFAILATRLLF
jgi:hypothetical protein